MRKSLGGKPILYPAPVFIIASYDENGVPDAMNAAWGGISGDKEISIYVDASHKTAKNVVARGAFTVSMADADHATACDYVGLVSGNKVPDKFEKAGFHATKSTLVDAPIIDELPMVLECTLVSYDVDSCRLVGEIVNVSIDEKVLDADGKISLEKFRPITLDPIHNTYLTLGEKAGNAFKDGLALK